MYGSSEISALQGHLNGAFVEETNGDETYAVVPNGYGNSDSESYVSFGFTNCESTAVQFAVRAHAPTGSDDSFYMQVDDGEVLTWHYPGQQTFEWQTFATTFTVDAGQHTLYVKHREDGTSLQAVRIVAGEAVFGALLSCLACEYTR